MKLLIVLQHRFELWRPPAWVAERLRHDFADLEVAQFPDYDQAEHHLADADAIVTWSLRPEQIVKAKRLKWIHSPSAAVHQFIIPEVVESGIILTNASSIHAPVVAEHAVALMFALARNLSAAFRYQQLHTWAQQQLWNEQPHPRELAGATAGIVGLGSIGTEVASRLICLGMRVIATRQHPEREVPEHVRAVRVLGPDELDVLLTASDYVVLCAPLRPSTQALMNTRTLAVMKRDACLINIGRGSLVDERALIEALRTRSIGGAALDVFESEPLAADSLLWDLPNALITPHAAAMTEKLWERHYERISENLRRFIVHETMIGTVDTKRGY